MSIGDFVVVFEKGDERSTRGLTQEDLDEMKQRQQLYGECFTVCGFHTEDLEQGELVTLLTEDGTLFYQPKDEVFSWLGGSK